MENANHSIVDFKLTNLTQGEQEMAQMDSNPVTEFQRYWPLMKTKGDWLTSWLQRQYTGEVNALASMEVLLESIKSQSQNPQYIKIVEKIISDENKHIQMISQLLTSRGIAPKAVDDIEILDGMDSWNDGCALASRAEAVRSGKARVLVKDQEVPKDVREAFSIILRDEAFHEKAFRYMAGEDNMTRNTKFGDWCKILNIESMC